MDNDEIISEDADLAKTFNQYFIDSVRDLDIVENNALLNKTDELSDPVEIALRKFESHPGILEIKKKVSIGSKIFFFKNKCI